MKKSIFFDVQRLIKLGFFSQTQKSGVLKVIFLPPAQVLRWASILHFSLFISPSFSQSPSVSWTMAHTKPAMQVGVEIFGDESGYFVVNKKPLSGMEFNPGITIEYFDKSQERKFANNITIPQIEDFVGIKYVGKTLYLFKALFSKEAGQNNLSAIPISVDGTSGKPVNLASMSASRLVARGLFSVAVSPDGNKLMVLSMPAFEKDANERIIISYYNEKLEKLSSETLTFNYPWTKAVFNEPYVNNDGVVFLLKKTDMKGEGVKYSVFSCAGKSLKEFRIPLEGNMKALAITGGIAPNGDMAVAGYYTENTKVSVTMGTPFAGSFFARIDRSGMNSTGITVNPFEKRKNLVAKRMVFQGEMAILLGEAYYVMERATDDPKRKAADPFARDYNYYGNDIFIDGFDMSGKLVYASRIDKENSSVNDNGTWVSYFGDISHGKLLILYNDDKYKYDVKKKAIVLGSNRIVVYAMVDPLTGAVQPSAPVDETGPVGGKGGDMLLRPDVFMKMADGKYIIRAENTEIYRMGIAAF